MVGMVRVVVCVLCVVVGLFTVGLQQGTVSTIFAVAGQVRLTLATLTALDRVAISLMGHGGALHQENTSTTPPRAA